MVKPIKFGTDGWRSIIAEDFTFENVTIVTKAVASYIKTNYDPSLPVLIGYDTRFLADKFALRAAETLNDLGFNVKVADRDVPTPVIAHAAKFIEGGSAGAIMITASHNPPEYCGIKYIPDYAGPATTNITDIIVTNTAKIQNGEEVIAPSAKKGTTEYFDPKPAYCSAIEKLIDFKKIKEAGIKIFYDPLYATGRDYFDYLLKKNGCEVEVIHNWIDPLYGGAMPEPKEKYLGELKALVIKNTPAVGFSNDGDADRFGVLDENGTYITPNEVISMLFKHLITHKGSKGSVVKTVATSQMIDKIAEMNGNIQVHETAVGFKWVGEIMRKEPIIIGGEESGGLSVLNHIPEKDGILADLAVLEAMAYEGKKLSEIIEDLKNEIGSHYINYRLDLKLTEETKDAAMTMFKENPPTELGGMKITKECKKDGAKFYFEDNNTWMLVRPSGTEPLLRIYFETNEQSKLDKLIEAVKKIV